MNKIMNAKHTPGPWIAVGWIVESTNDDIADICTCNPKQFGQIPRDDAEICANARLIAAAPELLALARKIARLNPAAGEIGPGMLNRIVADAMAAVAKAKGRE